MIFNNILVPLDGSKLAERALWHAGQLARRFRARVLLMRVLDTESAVLEQGPDSTDWSLRRLEANRYLRAIADHDALKDVDVKWYLAEGRPAEQIVQYARSHEVDLVILNAHGQGDAHEFPFGGTAQKIASVRGISCIILREGDAANDDRPAYRKVLVPLDGSRRAEWAINVACSISNDPECEIVFLHVVPLPEMPRRRPLTQEEHALRDRMVECNRDSARDYLAEVQHSHCANCKTRARITVSGRVAQTILDQADQEDADLIVLVAHEEDDEDTCNANTVCQYVLLRTARPVLILQDDRHQRARPLAMTPRAHLARAAL